MSDSEFVMPDFSGADRPGNAYKKRQCEIDYELRVHPRFQAFRDNINSGAHSGTMLNIAGVIEEYEKAAYMAGHRAGQKSITDLGRFPGTSSDGWD